MKIIIQELARSDFSINDMYFFMLGVLSGGVMAKSVLTIRVDNLLKSNLGQTSEGTWLSTGASKMRDDFRNLILNLDFIRPSFSR